MRRPPPSNLPPIIYRVNTESVLLDNGVIRAQDGGYFCAVAGFQGVGCYCAYAAGADEEDLEFGVGGCLHCFEVRLR